MDPKLLVVAFSLSRIFCSPMLSASSGGIGLFEKLAAGGNRTRAACKAGPSESEEQKRLPPPKFVPNIGKIDVNISYLQLIVDV